MEPNPKSEKSSAEMETRLTEDLNKQYGVYETQYFGFTPRSFSDGMYNGLCTFLTGYLDTFVKMLTEESECQMTKEELSAAQQHLLDKVIPSINKIFDKLHVYASENVFRIPDNVLLPRDEVHKDEPTDPELDTEQTLQEIEQLHKKLDCAMYMRAVTKDESSRISDVLPLYKNMDLFLNTIDSTIKSTGQEMVMNIKEQLRQLHYLQQSVPNSYDK